MTDKPDIHDWQWLAAYLERQENWLIPNWDWFSANGDETKTLSLLNRRISQLRTNVLILEIARLECDNASKAKLVYKVMMQNRDALERAEWQLALIKAGQVTTHEAGRMT